MPILGVNGAVQESAPVLLFGRVREQRAESSPDLHPVESVDRAIPSAGPVRFAVGSHIPRTLVMRAVKMVVGAPQRYQPGRLMINQDFG